MAYTPRLVLDPRGNRQGVLRTAAGASSPSPRRSSMRCAGMLLQARQCLVGQGARPMCQRSVTRWPTCADFVDKGCDCLSHGSDGIDAAVAVQYDPDHEGQTHILCGQNQKSNKGAKAHWLLVEFYARIHCAVSLFLMCVTVRLCRGVFLNRFRSIVLASAGLEQCVCHKKGHGSLRRNRNAYPQ